jgi:arylsulfatase A-like enzyme
MLRRSRRLSVDPLVVAIVLAGTVGWSNPSAAARPLASAEPPNILFIILDDVGMDQLRTFNPLAVTAPNTPNIAAIAAAGVRFTNVVAMAECSPSRATFFTGRYPLRTGVTAAILPNDLAAAQLSPYEMTTPRVLKTAGYTSAMIGKYHLGGPDNNPDGFRTPAALGWDYYNGNLQGGPPFIDDSVGGQYTSSDDPGRYSCGFPTGDQRGGCWFPDKGNKSRFDDGGGEGYTGKQCATLGGIPALDGNGEFTLSCDAGAGCRVPDFKAFNGYYTWGQVINDGRGLHRSTVRKYMTTFQTDAAIDWIRKQSKGGHSNRPWMATISYDAIHTPYQPPPDDLYPPGFEWPAHVPQDCTSTEAVRILSNLMLEAMDKEIGRLLVGIGLAKYGAGGELVYTPESANTMVVLVGDNGTYFSGVKYPYNLARAKGTVYETGIRIPVIVAGPQVVAPDREVDAMVNSVDFFQLFGEMAGVDVRAVVPREHVLDSRPTLGHLTDPGAPATRTLNFTQLGNGLKASTTTLYACVLAVGPSNVCTDILFTSEDLCVAELGTWYGPTAPTPENPNPPDPAYPTCCKVKAAQLPIYESGSFTIVPTRAQAVSNGRYKLVRQEFAECDDRSPKEFYDLSAKPLNPVNPLGLDNENADLLQNALLTPEQSANYQALSAALEEIMESEVSCPGDGNLDKRVDMKDFAGVQTHKGGSSVFDFNSDGATDDADVQIVLANMGTNCTT